MTEEDFLKRWSRRKRSSAEGAREVPESAPIPAETLPNSDENSAEKAGEPFNSATLPSIDSITSVSDITAFLRDGVPAELKHAALRRVWTADPAIRDFVGLAENAWDFTDPNAMPGFGPLEASDDVQRMIARIVDSIGQEAEQDAPGTFPETSEPSINSNDSNVVESCNDDAPQLSSVASRADIRSGLSAQDLSDEVLLQSNQENLAAQRDPAETSADSKQISRRGHGGALPR